MDVAGTFLQATNKWVVTVEQRRDSIVQRLRAALQDAGRHVRDEPGPPIREVKARVYVFADDVDYVRGTLVPELRSTLGFKHTDPVVVKAGVTAHHAVSLPALASDPTYELWVTLYRTMNQEIGD